MKLMCVRSISVVRRVARPFPARCHQFQRSTLGGPLSVTGTARRQVRGAWVLAAVGGFSCHALSVGGLNVSVCNNNSGVL